MASGGTDCFFRNRATACVADMLVRMISPRFALSEDQIDRVVQSFYARIRQHGVLGPVFNRHVDDWPVHEEKIARFWKKVILYQPGYDGNPMQTHLMTTDVKAAHFSDWLMLFDDTLRRTLPSDAAAAWSAIAHRIGRGLRLGIEARDDAGAGPPNLR